MDAEVRAAALIVRRGALAMQGVEAARGLELWARLDGVDLELLDAPGERSVTEIYHGWLREERIDIVLGPYGSGLVRRILPAVGANAKVLWNHGGSADDLTRPGVVQVVARASSYLIGAVRLCGRLRIGRVVIVTGKGPFAALVAKGARDEARRLGFGVELVIGADRLTAVDPGAAILVTAGFQEDVSLVRRIREGDTQPAALGCVAAGVPQFGERLGPCADGVIGPTQWIPKPDSPDIGPSGTRFRQLYEEAFGTRPGYVAAQAAAAGFLAADAHRCGIGRDDVLSWRTSTLLGDFSLDRDWRQVGYTISTIRWRHGGMELVPTAL
ncbi:MAG: ABC transporter substrate-binding protein [bacterium]|nr:ABC transporter substrate-binding protein [bacterium]MDE0287815.1 ABC transporter substrate-binding protein [bacterium]MDE0438306.1 ABC transporter substrate-binding protein [bacterium]